MLKLMTTAAVLVALIAPASTNDTIAPEWLGTWCHIGSEEDGSSVWNRGQCHLDAQLTIYPDRYEAPELSCKWTRSTNPNRVGKFTTGAKCKGDGDGDDPYKANIIILYGKYPENGSWLSLKENKCSGKKCWK